MKILIKKVVKGLNWEFYMRLALTLAEEAMAEGEIPVGAVVVRDKTVIGRGRNRRESDRDATAHAELLAIRDACRTLGDWRLAGCTLFVTLEPCPMCTGAILQSRMDTVVFGAFDEKQGCCGGRIMLPDEAPDAHLAVYGGVLETACSDLLQTFFAKMR